MTKALVGFRADGRSMQLPLTNRQEWANVRGRRGGGHKIRGANTRFAPTLGGSYGRTSCSPLGDFYQRIYQLACLYRPASYVAITVTSFTMRLPRALNPNENPAQFGIFFSADRLKNISLFAVSVKPTIEVQNRKKKLVSLVDWILHFPNFTHSKGLP
ncbi:MAG: hypothetical protein BECKG1743D_GA0114223_101383 [Candidatus Kentron sp. G]|nr:MAG: hypothetical protein BECKG1743F_GA0114225_101464 [Candidatus Kentron sp. G]VFM99500.1 MAG: hypothetical protein BECKG1743E_GA0114224_102612 [Candidatus Kentron sp. G]VFM99678.1 MAG: hypothetical protein BECKG1743D_GA0114223_101383 [Candidatus Kentron sp. G]